FCLYASPNHQVTKGRCITSNDPIPALNPLRNSPVYEYPLNSQWIMIHVDDGYILWTSIWKGTSPLNSQHHQMMDSEPDLALVIRQVQDGYLKIQGTWMLSCHAEPPNSRAPTRVAWPIRDDLIPLFE
ncbi:hypothetical protein BU15DRAFT_51320, partial [Melanogaster broomeanus]